MARLLSRGDVVDRYEVEGFLGEGGLSEVFRVQHRDLRSTHALKVLAIDLPNIHQRILAEGRVQAAMHHQNVVTVSDVVDVRGRPGLVMEFIDGLNLRDWLMVNQPTFDEALLVFAGIVRGVRAAHRIGLIHRDLKPENVLLAETEAGLVPKVMDFGLVKVLSDDIGQTQTGVMMGTPQYMAPEQIRDASRVDQRADIFSLGCMLYGMTCGVPAFRGTDVVTILNRTAEGDYTDPQVIRPDLPDHVAAAIRKMIQTDPADRPASCDEVLFDLFPERPPTEEVPRPVEGQRGPSPPPRAVRAAPDGGGASLTGLASWVGVTTVPAMRPPSGFGSGAALAFTMSARPLPPQALGWIAAAAGVSLIAASMLLGLAA